MATNFEKWKKSADPACTYDIEIGKLDISDAKCPEQVAAILFNKYLEWANAEAEEETK